MLEEQQLFANRYRLVKRLGQGAFSEVWRAEDTKAGNLTVALKVYAPEKGLDENGAKTFSEEFSLVFNMNHPNLLTPTYFDDFRGSPYLVLPFCERGSALNLVGVADEDTVAHFLYDVSSALAYLHEKGVIHQDIKPDNVLVDSAGSFKVTDFGISTKMRSTLRRSVGDKKGAGTMAYMGPERFSRTPETIMASDVWSLGATVYELICGDVPFGDLGGGMQKGGAEVPEVRGDYPAKLKELVEKCLAKDTWDRPTAAQIRDVCGIRIQKGYWDLSSLQPAAKTDPKRRPTVKRVDVPVDPPKPPKPSETQQERRPEAKPEPKQELELEQKSQSGDSNKIGLIAIGIVAAIVLVFLLVKLVPNKEERVWRNAEKSGQGTDYTSYVEQYPNGKHINEAKSWLYEYYKGRVENVERQTTTALHEFENEWNDYDASIQQLNQLWDDATSIYNAINNNLNELSGWDLQGRCNVIKSNLQSGVNKKLEDEESNLRLDPSEGTRNNISVLKSFHGYGVANE